jgi:hypothetical protein
VHGAVAPAKGGGGSGVGRWKTLLSWAELLGRKAMIGPAGMLGSKAFLGKNERKKKTGCKIEFQIYSKIRDSDTFKPNLK